MAVVQGDTAAALDAVEDDLSEKGHRIFQPNGDLRGIGQRNPGRKRAWDLESQNNFYWTL